MEKIKDIFFQGKGIRGEIGIEIEMEGKNFIMEDVDSWYSREDGSLRGEEEDKREYVLIRPCKREDVAQRLTSLEKDLTEYKSVINPSYRTGVHIHVNVRELTSIQVWNFIFTYLMLEDAMMKFCGVEREGNLFCLRNKDAEGMMDYMAEAIRHKSFSELFTDDIRYSSMNLKAIQTYGSIEFRGLPFNGDFKQVDTWVSLLTAVKDFAILMKDPKELAGTLSNTGGHEMAKEIFGNRLFNFPNFDWNKEMLEGIRRVQGLIFLNDWDDVESKTFTVKANLLDEPVKAFAMPQPVIRNPLDVLRNGV